MSNKYLKIHDNLVDLHINKGYTPHEIASMIQNTSAIGITKYLRENKLLLSKYESMKIKYKEKVIDLRNRGNSLKTISIKLNISIKLTKEILEEVDLVNNKKILKDKKDAMVDMIKNGVPKKKASKILKIDNPNRLLRDSIYTKDLQKILEFRKQGLSLQKIIIKLGYGTKQSLSNYLNNLNEELNVSIYEKNKDLILELYQDELKKINEIIDLLKYGTRHSLSEYLFNELKIPKKKAIEYHPLYKIKDKIKTLFDEGIKYENIAASCGVNYDDMCYFISKMNYERVGKTNAKFTKYNKKIFRLMKQIVSPKEIEVKLGIKTEKREFKDYLKNVLKYDYNARLEDEFNSKLEDVKLLIKENMSIVNIKKKLHIKYSLATLRLRIISIKEGKI